MKKLYLTEMEINKRNEIIKKNKKLIDRLKIDLHQSNMDCQEEDSRYILGDNWQTYIEYYNRCNGFFLILKDWRKFYYNLDKDYLSEENQKLYNKIDEKITKLYNLDYYSDEYYKLDEEIENDCEILLDDIEDLLHSYEEYPSEDEAIEYADEMEQLNDYYIEVREDGTSDNVIRRDVAFTETFI